MTTMTIDAMPRHRTFPDNLSSLKDWPSPLPFSHMDTISLPRVGISANDEEVVVRIFDSDEVRNARWFDPTIRALIALSWLPDGWNSYGAKRVKPRAIEKMLETLLAILEPNASTPTVVPTSEGGVQVEWHRNQIDFEIEATSLGELSFFFKSPTEEQEGPLVEDVVVLKKYVRTV